MSRGILSWSSLPGSAQQGTPAPMGDHGVGAWGRACGARCMELCAWQCTGMDGWWDTGVDGFGCMVVHRDGCMGGHGVRLCPHRAGDGGRQTPLPPVIC